MDFDPNKPTNNTWKKINETCIWPDFIRCDNSSCSFFFNPYFSTYTQMEAHRDEATQIYNLFLIILTR